MTSPETLELEAVDNALAGRYVAPEHADLAELALLLRDDRPGRRSSGRRTWTAASTPDFRLQPRRRRGCGSVTWWKPMAVVSTFLLPVVIAAALAAATASRWAATTTATAQAAQQRR